MKPERRARQSMKSSVVKRSLSINGRKTSVTLEDAFWSALRELALSQHVRVSELVSTVDSRGGQANLSSACRLFVLDHYREQAAAHQ
jgi:predicted DNA-binding ribbon-helix-helix protein